MIGFIKASLMYFGYLDFHSQQDLQLPYSNKVPENSDHLLIPSDGNSNSYLMIPTVRYLLKKVLMLKDYLLKELNGMEKRTILLMLNQWNWAILCLSYGLNPFILKESKNKRKESKHINVLPIIILSEQESEKDLLSCLP